MLSGLAATIAVIVLGILSYRRIRRLGVNGKRNAILATITACFCVGGFFLSQWPYHYSSTVKIVGVPTPIAFWELDGSTWRDYAGSTTFLFFAANFLFWALLPLCAVRFCVPKSEESDRHSQGIP
jgi:hypothetical protein